ncbi:MAG: MTH938/NDUFAF3 family protein [Calditrichia bacterium]
MHRINEYRFGKILIDDHYYDSDVIIFPDKIKDHWWRNEGHNLLPPDLPFLQSSKAGILVIGQGFYGRMQISDGVKKIAAEQKWEVKSGKTSRAVQIYNELIDHNEKNVVAALHLTC